MNLNTERTIEFFNLRTERKYKQREQERKFSYRLGIALLSMVVFTNLLALYSFGHFYRFFRG
jgi:hypothetical protein